MGYPFAAPDGDEERLNRQFAGLLHYSLQNGPELLNGIHEDQPFSFSDHPRVVATQDSPLPQYTETGPDREIDWVISDEDQLVGYESKYEAKLRGDQLRDELAKLRLNAGADQDAILVVVTMHTTPVSLLDRFEDEPVYWLSWFTVFRRLWEMDDSVLPQEQRPIRRMLIDLFEAEDMHPFTGFNHHDKLQYRYFIRDLRQELVGTEIEQPGEINTLATENPEATYKRIVPKRLDIPFVSGSRESKWSRKTSYLTVVVDTETHDVHVGIVFNVRWVEAHRKYVLENTDALIEYATNNELQVWASYDGLNPLKTGIGQTDDPQLLRTWVENGSDNAVRVNDTNYRKAIFVSECTADEPVELVQEAKEKLLQLYEDFLVSDELYPEPTLEEYE